jgi:tol-pal system protein YbgF
MIVMKSAAARSFAFAFVLSLIAGSAQAQLFGGFGNKQQNNDSELTVRIDRLESQIRQMTGTIEELQHRNQQLEQQLSAARGGAVAPAGRPQDAGPGPAGPVAGTGPAGPRGPGGGYSSGPGMAQGSLNEPPMAQPPYRQPNYQQPNPQQPQVYQAEGQPAPQGDAFDPSAHPNAPGAPKPLGARLGQPLDMGALAGRPGNPNEPPAINNRVPAQQQAVLPPSNSPKDEYDLAYGYILRRDYAQAEQAFRVFLQNHPGDRLVPDAHYWLGESQYRRQQYNDSAETFLDVYNKYPNSLKAPEALLRLGQSLAAIGKQDAACASLGAVLTKYPKASAHVKKTVIADQKRVRC